jgi:PleD family two-component response regulator
MINALLIDSDCGHAERLSRELNRRGIDTISSTTTQDAVRQLKSRAASFDLVIFCVRDQSQPWFERLTELQEAALQSGIREHPAFLCVARFQLRYEIQLRLEQMGVRHAM